MKAVRRIRQSEYTQKKLQELLEMKKELLGKRDIKGNREILVDIEDQIDNLLFISDLVSVKFSDSRHYEKIVKKGLKINGKTFVRLICSAGMARSNTVLFCNQEIEQELQFFLNGGRDTSIKLTPSKFSAYISLASSATYRVSTPVFCVVPDLVIKRVLQTDYISESPIGKDSTIEEKEIEIDVNLFDGQGLVNISKANDWAEELKTGYTPASFIFRGCFLKGLLITFDFFRVAEERGVDTIVDIYGNPHLIFDIDVIVSESQFKMANGYTSIEQFRQECKKRDFGWSVSRVSPSQDKTVATTNYQYIQNLLLDDDGIREICKDTLDWLSSVRQNSIWALLFLLGELTKEQADYDWFQKFSDPVVKAILLNPESINDKHIIYYIQRLVRKIELESKMGTLRVPGNYSFLMVDPYAQTEHALGLPVKGIVKQGHVYSNFWNYRKISEISVLRSPTTWISEIIKVQVQNDNIVNDYLSYCYSGLVFNMYDNYLLSLSGADVDGDIALSTPSLNKYICEDYRIPSYERKTAEKEEIDASKLYKSDIMSFGSKVGLLTNAGASLFGMLSLYPKDSIEYKTIIDRLKTSNAQQQMIIDSAKGIEIHPFPKWWLDRLSEEEKENLTVEEIELYNKLRIKSRPYFMRHVYPSKWGREYNKFNETYENLAQIRLGFSLKHLLAKEDKTKEELSLIDNYYKYCPLLDSPSPMNKLAHHMEQEIEKIKTRSKNAFFDWAIYLDPNVEIDPNKLAKMRNLYKEFSDYKRNSHDTGRKSKEQKDESNILFRKKLYEISSNLSELTNLAVKISYGEFPNRSKEFVWKLLSAGLIENLNRNNITRTIELPVESETGNISYLNKNYEMYSIEI